MKVAAEVRHFTTLFRAAADPDRAVNEKAYLKSDLEFFGAGMTATRRAAVDFHRAHPDLTHAELRALVEALWETPTYELRSVGIALLERYTALLTSADVDFILELLRRSGTWAYVDWLATKVLGTLVRRDRALLKTMRKWATDEDFWIRRSALLSLLDDLRAGEGEWQFFCQLAKPMLGEREFFIRKAIGWILREVSKKRPRLVDGFLTEHLANCSGLTLREGAKHLPPARRLALLAQHAKVARRTGRRSATA